MSQLSMGNFSPLSPSPPPSIGFLAVLFRVAYSLSSVEDLLHLPRASVIERWGLPPLVPHRFSLPQLCFGPRAGSSRMIRKEIVVLDAWSLHSPSPPPRHLLLFYLYSV